MDESRLRSHVGKRVALQFDHGSRVVGELTVWETDPVSVPVFGLATNELGSSGWNDGHRFRASIVTSVDEVP
jgi:hypothetical protein